MPRYGLAIFALVGGCDLVFRLEREPDAPVAPGDIAGPTEGLVAYWPLDDASGEDTSANEYTALFSGERQVLPGRVGNAIEFGDGGLLRVSALDGEAFPTSGSVALWILKTGSGVGNLFDEFADHRSHLLIRNFPEQMLQVACQVPMQDNYAAVLDRDFADGWRHVAVTWTIGPDTPRLSLFIDRVNVGNAPINNNWKPDDQEFAWMLGFSGRLDELRLYDRVLSGSEIEALPGGGE